MRVKGYCLCGSVAFEGDVAAEPSFGVCHCKMCQRWTGGPAFAINMQDVDITRPGELVWYKSSDWAERGFCGRCGTSLLYRMTGDPPVYIPYVGCIDLPETLRLAEHIYIDSKPGYYDFAGDAPRLTEAEFLARLQGGAPAP
jgi:hypothetical protein